MVSSATALASVRNRRRADRCASPTCV